MEGVFVTELGWKWVVQNRQHTMCVNYLMGKNYPVRVKAKLLQEDFPKPGDIEFAV